MIQRIERRTYKRLPHHATVYVSGSPTHDDFQTRTEDISAAGFYCHGPVPLAVGQRIDCIIEIATPSEDRDGRLRLDCKAEVVRLEPPVSPTGAFGIACQIRQYSVLGLLERQERWESSPDSATLPS